MIARARCSRCGETGRFDVGEVTTVEGAQAKLDGAGIESCPFGHHVEMSPIRYEVIELEGGQAPALEEWRAQMIGRGYDLWTTPELERSEIRIKGFAFGFPMAEVRGRDFHLDYTTSPDGDRYYYALAGAYAEAVAQR